MSPLSIIITHLYKSVPKEGASRIILQDISLSIYPSSITALIGRSGAGKSTLLRCLNGLDTIDSGQISITPKSETQQRLDIAMIFQAYTLLSRKTVLQNVCLPITLQGAALTEAHTQKAQQLLAEVGLSDKAGSYPSELSGGQRQRVAIARALMLDPGLLLCDELTSALDPKTTVEILALLKRVNKDHGVTIVLVTHDMDVVKEVADTVCVMDQGCIVEQGSVIDVLMKPKHPITRQLIDATTGGALPGFISDRIQTNKMPNADIVLKLIFTEESSTKPIIAAVATTFNVCFSIIAGSLDNLSDQQTNHMFGHLWVSCTPNDKLDAAIHYMTDHGVGVETLGYIIWE
ncbi:MAG: methionine ABC transporter ATP-binding protein [Alphaproteobacteria bacterium]|nr:methionine ABC transporter ATP-binding protein [Alphaproteobacteria bacterium]